MVVIETSAHDKELIVLEEGRKAKQNSILGIESTQSIIVILTKPKLKRGIIFLTNYDSKNHISEAELQLSPLLWRSETVQMLLYSVAKPQR